MEDIAKIVDGFPKLLPLTKQGRIIYELQFEAVNDSITPSQMTEYLSANFQAGEMQQFEIKVSVEFPWGWRSISPWILPSEFDEGDLWANYVDADDWASTAFRRFSVALMQRIPIEAAVGNDPHNDCLYNAIRKAFPFSNVQQPKTNKRITPIEFKELLGISRSEKVPLDRIPDIEKLLQIPIHLVGDHSRTSGNVYKSQKNKSITIRTKSGHATFESPPSIRNLNVKKLPAPKPLITSFRKTPYVYLNFDGTKVEEVPSHTMYQNVYGSNWVVPVRSPGDLEKAWRENYENNEAVKRNDFQDISRWSGRFDKCIRYFFSHYARLFECEPLDRKESEWISKASGGGLNWANNDTKLPKAHLYDIRSYYPSLLASSMNIPIKSGDFQTLSQEPEDGIWRYGIYRVKISPHLEKLVMNRKNEYYTSIEIQRALETGATVRLVQDGEANALLYPSDRRIQAKSAFKETVYRFYQQKKHGVVFAKRLLNFLWGSLCAKVKEVKYRTIGQPPIDCDSVVSVYETRPDVYRCEYIPLGCKSLYETCWARLGVFLTATGRVRLSRVIEPHLEKIHYVNTDGFVSSKEIPGLSMSDRFGDWKLEKVGSCYIQHAKKKEFV